VTASWTDLSRKAVERQNCGYPSVIRDRVVIVGDWTSQFDAADKLGISFDRVGLLIANGTLRAAENPASQAGVTTASVVTELQWRRTASRVSKLKRWLRHLVRWI